jgi:NhaP-type Na+/H+ or K+/H+ antiporter
VGTLVSFFVIFGLTFLVNKLEWITPIGKHGEKIILSTALMIKFSATISATDSVAALTLIKPSEHPKLFSVIFGEGMVNDAVAIILFKVVGTYF